MIISYFWWGALNEALVTCFMVYLSQNFHGNWGKIRKVSGLSTGTQIKITINHFNITEAIWVKWKSSLLKTTNVRRHSVFVAQATWRVPGIVDLGLRLETGPSWIQSRNAVHCRTTFYFFDPVWHCFRVLPSICNSYPHT